MICLGIETTAHTFGASVVDDGASKGDKKIDRSKVRILSNVKDSYTTEAGGMIPKDAAEHHVAVCGRVIQEALDKAGVRMRKVDIVSFSQGPGLGHCLRIGAMAARLLAAKHNLPLVGVNHCIAHLEIGRLVCDAHDPVLLYVSGANTQVIAFDGGRYRIFGETLDIGVGNFLDCFARCLGLGFPGGPKIYELALKGKNYIKLPYVVKGMDVSFGGLLTNLKQKIESGSSHEDLAFSVQETVFAMLLEVSERALAHCNKGELLLGGGVACNKRLVEMAKRMCEARGASCFVPEPEFLLDNAAMIAWNGLLVFRAGETIRIEDSIIRPYWRTDEVNSKLSKACLAAKARPYA
ncbi:UGMP family protein [Candidatus Woesearchaeota archaeon CG08_land_8_20_14_0_20_47_9]|nr:MAG: UGMP family protein [Candidatus Woesearchaeota archaeon CG08_land_8_20_14_0_20_47_9]